ncbi:MAG: hypothetical protein HQ559_15930 [Lentisphaerae bacterium]|nr:hypothetical protein [Lentisphaerota bacterium]
MKAVKIGSILIILVIAGGWLTVKALTIHIPIGQVGVRIQQYSLFGNKGLVKKDFAPGWHRDLGPIDNWEVFDSTVQSLEMTKDPTDGSRAGRDDVQVQSADGYAISLDVTVKYRIRAGAAHELYRNTGSGTKYRTIVRNQAEQACMGLFGKMKTEDFYNPTERRRTAKEVSARLAQSVKDNHIEVIDVLIRDVEFDPEYESKIRTKKLADQEVELNKSLAAAATMRGKTQVIEAETKKLVNIIVKEKEAKLVTMQAETDLDVAKIKAAYDKYATEKRADADLVQAEKEAEGQRLVKKAEAEGERLRNESLQGSGSDVMVALEAAKNLTFSDVTISTMNVDLLDINGMVKKLGVEAEK